MEFLASRLLPCVVIDEAASFAELSALELESMLVVQVSAYHPIDPTVHARLAVARKARNIYQSRRRNG